MEKEIKYLFDEMELRATIWLCAIRMALFVINEADCFDCEVKARKFIESEMETILQDRLERKRSKKEVI